MLLRIFNDTSPLVNNHNPSKKAKEEREENGKLESAEVHTNGDTEETPADVDMETDDVDVKAEDGAEVEASEV